MVIATSHMITGPGKHIFFFYQKVIKYTVQRTNAIKISPRRRNAALAGRESTSA
jgi:hypothetical protein